MGDKSEESAGLISLTVKWQDREIVIDTLEGGNSVADLKKQLEDETQVRTINQKLMGLKARVGGATKVNDGTLISDLVLKRNLKIMMLGSVDEEIHKANTRPDDLPDVVDDFNVPVVEDMPTELREEFLAKIDRRVKEYKIEEFIKPEKEKKLLGADHLFFSKKNVMIEKEQGKRCIVNLFEYKMIALKFEKSVEITC